MQLLEVEVTDRADGFAAVVSGELDLSTIELLENELADAFEREPQTAVLDLRGLDFLDSSGLRLILQLHARQREAGRRLVVVTTARPVTRVFELTGADNELEIVADPDQIDGTGS